MQVRLLKHWNGYRPGTILANAGDGMANVLIDRGLAEPVKHKPKETAAEPVKHKPKETAGKSKAPAKPR